MKNKKINIFREESLENVSAPEQLTDYLRIANPSSWLVLFALILLFGGLVVWGSIGQLETVAGGTAVVSDETARIIVTDINKGEIKKGMIVRINSEETAISSVESDEYGRIIAYAPIHLKNGFYDAGIVTESISPIGFLVE